MSRSPDVQFTKLLLWGEGLVQPTRFQHFHGEPHQTTRGSYLDGGSSGISKGFYYSRLLKRNDDEGLTYRKVLSRFEGIGTAPLTDADAFELSRRLRDHLASGEAYGLRELALLDFFYLNEWIRRWQSAHLAINLFDKSVLPFFSIDHIKLAFAMRPLDKAERRFQRFIIAQNAEELLHVAFGNSLRFKLQDRLLRLMSRTKWLGGVLKTLSWADYLRGDGKPQIDRIFSSDTPLWQILDRERATAKWNAFLRGSDQSIQFPLGLMAFRRWYAMYSESTPGLDLPMS